MDDIPDHITERDLDLIDDIHVLRNIAKFLLRKLNEAKNRYTIREAPPNIPAFKSPKGPDYDVTQVERDLAAVAVDKEAEAYRADIDKINELLDAYRMKGDKEALKKAGAMLLDLKVKVSRRKKTEAYLVTIRRWDQRGYDVDALIEYINQGDVASLEAALDTYKQAIQRIDKIKNNLSRMDIPPALLGYVDQLLSVIKDPRRVMEGEKIMNKILEEKAKLEEKFRRYAPPNNYNLKSFYEGNNEKVLEFLRKVISGRVPPSLIYIYGPTGSGKTHLLVGLYKGLEGAGKTPVFLTKKVLHNIKDDFSEITGLTSYIIYDSENDEANEEEDSLISSLIDAIMDREITLVISGRRSPEEIATQNERLADRLSIGMQFYTEPITREEFSKIAHEIFKHYGDSVEEDIFMEIIEKTYGNPALLKKKITEILAAKAITGSISHEQARNILEN